MHTSGVAIPGDAESSRLVRAIRYESKVKMPPAAKLPDAEIDALTKWVAAGAIWPETPAGPETKQSAGFWAFQPVRKPAVPSVKNTAWARTISTASFSPGSKRRTSTPFATPTSTPCCGASPSTSPDSCLRLSKSTRSSRTIRRKPSNTWSTGCSPRPRTEIVGDVTGSTSPIGRIPPASAAASLCPTPGATAITSSTLSIMTSPTISSFANRSPARTTRAISRQRCDGGYRVPGARALGLVLL